MEKLRPTAIALSIVLGALGCPAASSDKVDPQSHGDDRIAEGTNSSVSTPLGLEARMKIEVPEEIEKRTATYAETYKTKETAAALYALGQKEEAEQNHKDAALAFTQLAVNHPTFLQHADAMGRMAQNWFRVAEYDLGLQLFADLTHNEKDAAKAARLRRVLGNLYLSVPHWGMERGGKFQRGQHGQGKWTQSHATDRMRAVHHLEKARELMTQADPPLDAEVRHAIRIDLITALARFSAYDGTWGNPWYGWGSDEPDGLEDDEGDDEHAGKYRGRRRGQKPPRGLPLNPDGSIAFAEMPAAYSHDDDDVAKMKFLLDEMRKTDKTENKQYVGQSWLMQALLFSSRDGFNRMNNLQWTWVNGGYPYKEALKDHDPSELKDNEAFGLVGTSMRRFALPDDETVPKLLTAAITDAPESPASERARFLLGQFYQSRSKFPAALEAYQGYLQKFDKGSWAYSARNEVNFITQADFGFVAGGVQGPDKPVLIDAQTRNLDEIDISIRVIDEDAILRDFKKAYRSGRDPYRNEILHPDRVGYALVHDNYSAIGRYAKKSLPGFKAKLPRREDHRAEKTTIEVPIKKPGTYLLEATHKANNVSIIRRTIVQVAPIAIITKQDVKSAFAWIVDAKTGAPLKNAKLDVLEYWTEYKDNKSIARSKSHKAQSDKDGIARLKQRQHSLVAKVTHKSGTAITGLNYWYNGYSPRSYAGRQFYAAVYTDRPVYRPGDNVDVKAWVRLRNKGEYQPATTVKNISFRIRDAQGGEVLNKTLPAGEFGSGVVSLETDRKMPLGVYTIEVRADGSYTQATGNSFRIEEYKAPEFEVGVEAKGDARLGDTVDVKIAGTYLFGGPVQSGTVKYRVYREDYRPRMALEGPWDWLYGRGYGRCFHPYSWYDWWGVYGPVPYVWYPWWGPEPKAPRELMQEGEGKLDDEGKLAFKIETAALKASLGERDHRFVIKAEVRDASRRIIKGEGEVFVTRNAYIASLETASPYAFAREEVTVHVQTMNADGSPRAAQGEVVIEKLNHAADGQVRTQSVTRKPLTMDKNGNGSVRFRPKSTGQFKFTFVGPTKSGDPVKASTVSWIVGPGFRGLSQRMNGVEIYTDKRTYQVGDTAKILLQADNPGATVLLGTRAENGTLVSHRLVKLDGKSLVTEVPVTVADVPNFFVEATTVAEGNIFERAQEVLVPPQDASLNVSVRAKNGREKLGPGEKMTFVVETKDDAGNPVPADVALSVFDKAVTYISPETLGDVRVHFWGQRRSHNVSSTSSLKRTFGVYGALNPPANRARSTMQSEWGAFFQQESDWRYGTTTVKGMADLRKQEPAPADDALSSNFADKELQEESKAESKKDSSGRRSRAKNKKAAAPAESRAAGRSALSDAAPSAKRAEKSADADDAEAPPAPPPGQDGAAAKPRVRKNFRGTAAFEGAVRTGADGRAEVTVTFPDNLTTWKVRAVGFDGGARMGDARTSVVTTKDLLVRLETPRFFRERDEVVLTALVQNKSKTAKDVQVRFELDEGLLTPMGKKKTKIRVKAQSEGKYELRVKVKGEGTAVVLVEATSGKDGDAKQLSIPVLVYGVQKQVAATGSILAADKAGTKTVTFEVPEARRKDLSWMSIRFSPSLAGGMLDALPYLLDYPYGCTEQTLSRFVPAVLTRKALQQAGGKSLEELQKNITELNAAALTPGGKVQAKRNEKMYRRLARSPVFNTAMLNDMIAAGTKRLKKMQNSDGGWGWWGRDGSSRYTTAHVVNGLLDAQSADVRLPSGMLSRGQNALNNLVQAELYEYKRYKEWIGDADAYAAYVQSRYKYKNDELLGYLFTRRKSLSISGKLYAALAHFRAGNVDKAKTLLKNAEQVVRNDDEIEIAWLETSKGGWWYWYNQDVETNALYLRTLDEMRPGNDRSPRVVKWLLNNRRHGTYWNSTRDTAAVVAAMANHMQKTNERAPDYDLEVYLDDKLIKTVHIDKTNLLTFDGEIRLSADEVTSGEHEVRFERKGQGAVYYNTYLSYFTTEDKIKGTGLDLKVTRNYYRLVRQDRENVGSDDLGRKRKSREVAYRKVKLEDGAHVDSGDLILVELMIDAKNDYTFLAFEDPKPAGMEPVALVSGRTYGEAVANMELRDEKVVFFLRELQRGELRLTYRLYAQIPGTFHAMPTHGYGMYAPELDSISDSMRVIIDDEGTP